MVLILSVVGTRPQFIKACMISREIKDRIAKNDSMVKEVMVNTGQHYDDSMSEVFFKGLEMVEPKWNLGLRGIGPAKLVGEVIIKVVEIIEIEKPDVVLVYGDCNTTLAGAIAGWKCGVPVAHVEAGMRSFQMEMPEERNRILVDNISQWWFCPSRLAMEELMDLIEDHEDGRSRVHVVGDLQVDLLRDRYPNRVVDSADFEKIRLELDTRSGVKIKQGGYFLVTLHRAESAKVKKILERMVKAMDFLSRKTGKMILWVGHPAVNHGKILCEEQSGLVWIDPVDYQAMMALVAYSYGVITDSGGLQKEVAYFGKRGIIMRKTTEWRELLVKHGGMNVLVDPKNVEKEDLVKVNKELVEAEKKRKEEGFDYYPNNSAKAIIDVLSMIHK